MKFVEFMVFICRISHEHYSKTDYVEELLHLKVNYLMPLLVSPLNLLPLFVSDEKFLIDAEKEKKKLRRRMSKLNVHMTQMKKFGQEIEKEMTDKYDALRDELGESVRDLSDISESSNGGRDSMSEQDLPEGMANLLAAQ